MLTIEFVRADPCQNADARKFSRLVDIYSDQYRHQALAGAIHWTFHSDSHYPPYNYLYQSKVSVEDSAFYNDNIDKELVASKGLSEEHILAANIEECKTYDPNTNPHYGKSYRQSIGKLNQCW